MPIIVNPAVKVTLPATHIGGDDVLRAVADPGAAGVLLVATFPANAAYKVRFLRNGEPVRSGADAWAPGGMAVAYDAEAPIGVASTWTATPLTRPTYGAALVAGTTAAPVALTIPDLDEDRDVWIKSIPNPTRSLRLRSQVPDPSFSQAGRNALADIPGSTLLAGSWDLHTLSPRTLTFLTSTVAERDQLLDLLNSGPLLVQMLKLYGIRDFYALAGDYEESYFLGAFDPRRVFTVSFAPIARPGVIGAPLYVPGQSYDDIAERFASYAALNGAGRTYGSVLE